MMRRMIKKMMRIFSFSSNPAQAFSMPLLGFNSQSMMVDFDDSLPVFHGFVTQDVIVNYLFLFIGYRSSVRNANILK